MRWVRGKAGIRGGGQMRRFQATAGGKSLLLKAITILYDVTMKTLITLLLACCFGSAMAQSSLPACLGTDVTRWTACFGTERTAGHTYIGEFKNGMSHGKGMMDIFASGFKGDKYVGEFHNGSVNGQGTYTYANGNKHVGEYKDGLRNGQGTYTFADGENYVGEFKDGERNGQGTATFANGSKYVGEYKDGKGNGQGTFFYLADNQFKGDKYVGEYKDNKKNGQGTYTAANGNKYVGEFKDDKYNGQGIKYLANGNVDKSGIWQENELIQSKFIDVVAFPQISRQI